MITPGSPVLVSTPATAAPEVGPTPAAATPELPGTGANLGPLQVRWPTQWSAAAFSSAPPGDVPTDAHRRKTTVTSESSTHQPGAACGSTPPRIVMPQPFPDQRVPALLQRLHPDEPDAIKEAKASDRRPAERKPPRPLEGVPIVIKDSLNFAGVPTTWSVAGHLANRRWCSSGAGAGCAGGPAAGRRRARSSWSKLTSTWSWPRSGNNANNSACCGRPSTS